MCLCQLYEPLLRLQALAISVSVIKARFYLDHIRVRRLQWKIAFCRHDLQSWRNIWGPEQHWNEHSAELNLYSRIGCDYNNSKSGLVKKDLPTYSSNDQRMFFSLCNKNVHKIGNQNFQFISLDLSHLKYHFIRQTRKLKRSLIVPDFPFGESR